LAEAAVKNPVEREYVVTWPIRGTQTAIVRATSAREARRIANEERISEAVDPVDFRIDWDGQVQTVHLDRGQ
jgi:hypothetical protein